MAVFEESWKRIERAAMHAKRFRAEWESLFGKDGYSVRVNKEDKGTFVAEAVFTKDVTLNTFALELGEMFYQLRAALDGAVWQGIVFLEGADPAADANRLDFPICPNLQKFNMSALHQHKFPKDLLEWLATIQPYCTHKPGDDPDNGLRIALERIHDCARKDRHRRLHVAAAVADTIEYGIISNPPYLRIAMIEPLPVDFLKGKNKFIRFSLESMNGLPIDKAELATEIGIDVSFNEIPVWSEGGFFAELKRFGMAVENVINKFEEAFARHVRLSGGS